MQNEILKPVLASDATPVPRYNIINDNGVVVQRNVQLQLQNEVEQEGTPYDQDSVLPTQLQQELGLPNSATPADAFRAVLAKAQPAVGDIKQTYRTDLGEDWALCNGDFLNPNEYPELAVTAPDFKALIQSKLYKTITIDTVNLSSYAEGNGYQVIAYSDATDDEDLHIAVSTDRFSTFTTYLVSTGTYYDCCIRFVNGYWILAYTTESGKIGVFSTEDIMSNTWNDQSLTDIGAKCVHDIWYSTVTAMYYLAVSASSSSSSTPDNRDLYIYSSMSPTFSGYSSSKVVEGKTLSGLVRTDTQVVAAGSTNNTTMRVYYAPVDNPTAGTFIELSQSSSTTSGSTLSYANGYYIYKTSTKLYFTQDVTQVWSELIFDTTIRPGYGKIGYYNGYYITPIAEGQVLVGTDLNDASTWEVISARGVPAADQYSPCMPIITDESIDFMLTDIYVRFPALAVPTVDSAPLYTYMKVK